MCRILSNCSDACEIITIVPKLLSTIKISKSDVNGFKDLFAEATKFDAIKFFHAQYQRKDGREVKFMNFSREKHEFPAF